MIPRKTFIFPLRFFSAACDLKVASRPPWEISADFLAVTWTWNSCFGDADAPQIVPKNHSCSISPRYGQKEDSLWAARLQAREFDSYVIYDLKENFDTCVPNSDSKALLLGPRKPPGCCPHRSHDCSDLIPKAQVLSLNSSFPPPSPGKPPSHQLLPMGIHLHSAWCLHSSFCFNRRNINHFSGHYKQWFAKVLQYLKELVLFFYFFFPFSPGSPKLLPPAAQGRPSI